MPAIVRVKTPWSQRAAQHAARAAFAAKQIVRRHPLAAAGLGAAAAGAASVPLGKKKAVKRRTRVAQLIRSYKARKQTEDTVGSLRILRDMKDVLDRRVEHPASVAAWRAAGLGTLGAGGAAYVRKLRKTPSWYRATAGFRRSRRKPPPGKGPVIEVKPISVKHAALADVGQWVIRHPLLAGVGIGTAGALIGKLVEQPPKERIEGLREMIREERVGQEVEPTYSGQKGLARLQHELAATEAMRKYPIHDVLHRVWQGAMGGAFTGWQASRIGRAMMDIYGLGAAMGTSQAQGGR